MKYFIKEKAAYFSRLLIKLSTYDRSLGIPRTAQLQYDNKLYKPLRVPAYTQRTLLSHWNLRIVKLAGEDRFELPDA